MRLEVSLVPFLLFGCVAGTDEFDCGSECGPPDTCQNAVCVRFDGGGGPTGDGGRAPRDGGRGFIRDGGPWFADDAGTERDGGPMPPIDAGMLEPPPPDPGCMTSGAQTCTCTDGRTGVRQCRSDDTFGACVCGDSDQDHLARLRGGIVGLWQGTRTTIWDGTQPVLVEFLANGTHGALCVARCSVFYWGIDGPPTPARVYALYDVTADRTGRGDLDIIFFPDSTTGQRYAMERVEIDALEETLRFEFHRPDNNNPVFFDLERVPR